MFCPVDGPVEFTDSWGLPGPGGQAQRRRHDGLSRHPHGGPGERPGAAPGFEPRRPVLVRLRRQREHVHYGTHLQGREPGRRLGRSGHRDRLRRLVGERRRAEPHLHFEIHPGGGAAVNPYPATADACFG